MTDTLPGVLAVLRHIQRLAAGDLSVRSEVPGENEGIDEIIRALNMLTEDLREREQWIRNPAASAGMRAAGDRPRGARDAVLLEEFAYVASHDLREPLRRISCYADLLGQEFEGALGETGARYVRHLVSDARRIQRLVESLSEFSAIVTRLPTTVAVNMTSATRDAVASLGGSLPGSDASVTWGTLPTVRGDPDLLRTVLAQLIGNSLRFRSEKSPQIRIEGYMVGREWHFSVADNGIGFEPRSADRIFRLFARLLPDEYPGAGMGLAICKRVIEAHGGRVGVCSSPGRGALFWFTLPL